MKQENKVKEIKLEFKGQKNPNDRRRERTFKTYERSWKPSSCEKAQDAAGTASLFSKQDKGNLWSPSQHQHQEKNCSAKFSVDPV